MPKLRGGPVALAELVEMSEDAAGQRDTVSAKWPAESCNISGYNKQQLQTGCLPVSHRKKYRSS